MSDALPESPQLEPSDLSQATFTRTRKGLEPAQVRSLLGRAEDALRVWASRDSIMTAQLDDMRRRLESAEDLDEAKVTEMLGSQTARVISAAREASAEIRSAASEEAAAFVADAQSQAEEAAEKLQGETEAAWELASAAKETAVEEASVMLAEAKARAETELSNARELADQTLDDSRQAATELAERSGEKADDLISDAQSRHDELIAAASSIFDENTARAEEAATAIRLEAERSAEELQAEAEQNLEIANSEASAQVEAARDRGREMLAETKQVRERILQDLATRRRTVKQKMEAARAARGVIVESIQTMSVRLEDTLAEVAGSEVEAQRVADAASAEVVDDVENFADGLAADLDTSADEPVDTEAADTEPSVPEGDGDGSAEASETATPASPKSGPVSDLPVSDVPANSEGSAADQGADAAAAGAPGRSEVDSGDAVVLEGVSDGEPGGNASVHDIFEKMRESEEMDDLDDLDGPGDLDDSDDDHSGGSDRLPADVIDLAPELVGGEEDARVDEGEAELQGDGSVTTLAPPTPKGDSEILDRRDELLAPSEKLMARAFKRLINDEQNAVLDRARRVKRGRIDLDDLMGQMEPATFADALGDSFLLSAVAGAQMWCEMTGSDQPDLRIEQLSASLETRLQDLFELRRIQLRGVLEQLDEDGEDSSALVDRLRASYRDMRSTSVPEYAADLSICGFTEGTVVAAGSDAQWRWVPDNGGIPCSDAEDNSLAGMIMCGAEFPTGDDRPPAHPGCRCILAPGT